ncbi:MAG: protein kinase domain-containing protein [Planctomycetales bacterium]
MNKPRDDDKTHMDLAGGSAPQAEPPPTLISGPGGLGELPGSIHVSDPGQGQTVNFQSPSAAGDAVPIPPESGSDRTIIRSSDESEDGTGSVPSVPDAAAVSIDGYEVLGELGRGGMGVVYRARQSGLNRIVAIKMVIAGGHAGSEQLARFRAEAEAVAKLQHPNIVQVYDIGEQDGLPFFSLEYVDGMPLDKDLAGKPQPDATSARIIQTLAKAMQFAHEHGIVHRDLKPANVLLTKDGIPKISDFGLAKQLESDSSKTRTGTIMGTPSYMAPEQGRGEKQVGSLADVYALGSMLYEMICGRPPFLSATPLETLMRLLKEEPVPPSRLQPRVSRDLETICLKCLQKDPHRRYESAAALAEDLRRFQSGEPIQARPVGRPERAWQWCKRNPRIAAMSGAIALLIGIVGVTLSVMGMRMARDRAAIAETRQQAQQRLEQATQAAAGGGFSRAQDLLQWSDPLLTTTPALADVREELNQLGLQVAAHAEFRQRLDAARYLGLFGSAAGLPKAQEACHELIELYDRIEQKKGDQRYGWPPLYDRQRELLQEDIFEAFLISAQVERTANLSGDKSSDLPEATRKAIAWLDRAEQLLPPTKALFVRRGGYHEILGNAELAKADLERAGEIDPKSAVDRFWHAFADYSRAEGFRQKGDLKSAVASYREAIAGFARVVETRPENFWAYFTWATCHTILGNRFDALVGFTTCISLRPDAPWPYGNRGTVHMQLGETELALEDFNKAIELGPQDAANYLRRGGAYFALKEFGKAHDDYATVIRLQPKELEAYRSQAVVSLMGKNLDEAIADWQALADRLPASHEPHYYLGAIHLGRGEFERALAELETALKLKAEDPQSHMAKAMIHRWQGQTDVALQIIDQIVKQTPKSADYLIERADLLRSLERFDEALESYELCLALQPKLIDAYLGLARIFEQQGKLFQARECCERMVKADPTNATVYLRRAEFLRNQGEFAAAAADCAQAAKIDPKSPLPALVEASLTAAQGNPTLAVQQAQESLEKSPEKEGSVLYAAACVWSLAAHSAEGSRDPETAKSAGTYAERSAQFLAEVVGICFHDLQYPDHNRLAWDPALAQLRKLPQVEKLLAGRK